MRRFLLPLLLASVMLAGICLNAEAQTLTISQSGTLFSGSVQMPICPPQSNCVPCSPCTNAVTPAPFNLTFAASNTWIRLNWQNPPGLMTNLVIRAPNTILGLLVNGETSFTDTGLQPSTSYQYAIVGMAADLFGVFKTLTPTNPPPPGLVAPTSLTFSSPSPGTAVLGWSCNGSQTGFWITINGQMSGWGEGATNLTATTFQRKLTGLPPGSTTFGVDAHDALGNYKFATITGVVQ